MQTETDFPEKKLDSTTKRFKKPKNGILEIWSGMEPHIHTYLVPIPKSYCHFCTHAVLINKPSMPSSAYFQYLFFIVHSNTFCTHVTESGFLKHFRIVNNRADQSSTAGRPIKKGLSTYIIRIIRMKDKKMLKNPSVSAVFFSKRNMMSHDNAC